MLHPLARRLLCSLLPFPLLLALLGCELGELTFETPLPNQLSGPDGLAVSVLGSGGFEAGTAELWLDGVRVDPSLVRIDGPRLHAVLSGLSEGAHELTARASFQPGPTTRLAVRRFQVIGLDRPDECEVLNDDECLLPYPSSRFQPEAATETGVRMELPASGMPQVLFHPVSPEPWRELDGTSPGVHPVMFFPGGVDLAASRAPVLDPTTRTFSARSLDLDSPTVLLDAETGERVLHMVELDTRIGVSTDPSRQVMFLRPGRTLEAGRRYIVAVRRLVRPGRSPVRAEPAFAALRDGRATNIDGIERRREGHERIFERLEEAGVGREDLLLAFDFVTQSRQQLTGRLLTMRDRTLTWLEAQDPASLFQVDRVVENDCTQGGIWRDVEGTFRVPLFLTNDPLQENRLPGFVLLDSEGDPRFDRVVDARFTVLVPCRSLEPGFPVRPILHAHGGGGDHRTPAAVVRFWNGQGATDPVAGFPDTSTPLVAPDYLIAGTDNYGFGNLDFEGGTQSFLFSLFFSTGAGPSLSARLHQGQMNLLVLGRLMKQGLFNVHPAFRTPAGAGVFPGAEDDLYAWGVSFGGFSTLIQAAISPDVTKAAASVAVLNFANQAQRDTVFDAFDGLLPLAVGPDAMTHAVVFALSHDLWAQGDPIAYLRHIRDDPLPGAGPKDVLFSIGLHDQKSPNLFSDIAARDLGLASTPGSIRKRLVGIPDAEKPQESAYVAWWTALDVDDPAHAPYIPPLTNRTATATACDPHVLTWMTPAYLDQVSAFFQPGGRVEHTCTGLCDGREAAEREWGNAQRCDPTAP